MKIEKFRVGGIEHGAIRIGKKLIVCTLFF